MHLFDLFTDPLLRAPTLGSMLMCLSSALCGVLLFVRKRTLLGETLSHAAYPGVGLMVVVCGYFSLDAQLPFLILAGAFVSSLLGFIAVDRLEKRVRVAPDSALTAVLALFFGVGVVLASCAQSSYPRLLRQVQAYLYGQTATMTDGHIALYAVLTLVIVTFIVLFYKKILILCFDRQFAYSAQIAGRALDMASFCVVVLALVIGLRCIGVVLMSAMLIAPPAAARQFTTRLSWMFVISALFGALSAFLGSFFSFMASSKGISVPTGPLIVLFSGAIALLALFFAPKRGLVVRSLRIVRFKNSCLRENVLKALWRRSQQGEFGVSAKGMAAMLGIKRPYLSLLIRRLKKSQALEKRGKLYYLSPKGMKSGAHIVRLHRLWELYLVHSLGLKIERVHASAEEMEHILTPQLEKQLTELLDDPKHDPHKQPIPEGIR